MIRTRSNIETETEEVEYEVPEPYVYMENDGYVYIVPADVWQMLPDWEDCTEEYQKTLLNGVVYESAILVVRKSDRVVAKARYF